TPRRSAVRGGLDAVQLRVLTALGHQLIVRADLHEPGPVEHDDEIGHADRRETVGDEDRNAATVALAGASCRGGVALEQRVFSLRGRRPNRPCAARGIRSGKNPGPPPPDAPATRPPAGAPAACRPRGSSPMTARTSSPAA